VEGALPKRSHLVLVRPDVPDQPAVPKPEQPISRRIGLSDLPGLPDERFWDQALGFLRPDGHGLESLAIHDARSLPRLIDIKAIGKVLERQAQDVTAPRPPRAMRILTELERFGVNPDTVWRHSYVPIAYLEYVRKMSSRHRAEYPEVKRKLRSYTSLIRKLALVEHVDQELIGAVIDALRPVVAYLSDWPNEAKMRAWRRRFGVNVDSRDIGLTIWTTRGRQVRDYIKPLLIAAEASDTPAHEYVFDLFCARYPKYFMGVTKETFRRRIT
jgi:hypothetical protein